MGQLMTLMPNVHGRNALQFCTLSGSQQLTNGFPRHTPNNCLDLVITNVPNIVEVSIGTKIGNSDHCHLNVKIDVKQEIPQFTIQKKIYLKHRTNWDSVRAAIRCLLWSQIFRAPDPVQELNHHLTQVINRFVPTRTLRIRSNDKPWFDVRCRTAFDAKQTAYKHWRRYGTGWQAYVEAKERAITIFESART